MNEMRKFLARLRAGLMGWGERRGEPGGMGEAGVALRPCGAGDGDREAVAAPNCAHTYIAGPAPNTEK